MKTENAKLAQVRVNEANPRTITDTKFGKLIDSLLALPKMLDMRPVVVDNTMTALGGNMRYRALCAIAEMDETELRQRIAAIRDVQKKTEAEQERLTDYWLRWKDAPTVPVIRASELTDDERRQFIIKDNASFGQWDYDALANQWDATELNSWGVDVWGENPNSGWDADTQAAGGDRPQKATERLSELKFDTPYYQPKKIVGLTLEGCVDNGLFDAKNSFIESSGLTEAQKTVMREFAYRFKKIDFEGVANYYAFFATDEEKAVMERLRLVLVDDGSVAGFFEDDLIRTYDKFYPTEIEFEEIKRKAAKGGEEE